MPKVEYIGNFIPCWNTNYIYKHPINKGLNSDDLSNKIWTDQSGGVILQGQNMNHCIYIKVKSISVYYSGFLNET